MTSRTTTAIALNARALPVVDALAVRGLALVALVLVLVLITSGGAG